MFFFKNKFKNTNYFNVQHIEKKRNKKKSPYMFERRGAPNVERHMVDQVFQNELRDLKDKCCVYMTFLSCYRLTSVCKYFCPYFIGRFAKIYLWKTVVCLFVLFVSWNLPNHDTFGYHWKALDGQGCIKLVTQFSTYREKTTEYWEEKFIEN